MEKGGFISGTVAIVTLFHKKKVILFSGGRLS